MFRQEEADLVRILPDSRSPWIYYAGADQEYSAYEGFFKTDKEVDTFLGFLAQRLT